MCVATMCLSYRTGCLKTLLTSLGAESLTLLRVYRMFVLGVDPD